MSYTTIPLIARDAGLKDRIHAAIISEDVAGSAYKTPAQLALLQRELELKMWYFAAQPGWALAWESALAVGIVDPGRDAGVITDGMILSAVQTLN